MDFSREFFKYFIIAIVVILIIIEAEYYLKERYLQSIGYKKVRFFDNVKAYYNETSQNTIYESYLHKVSLKELKENIKS